MEARMRAVEFSFDDSVKRYRMLRKMGAQLVPEAGDHAEDATKALLT
jgi:hypothetical protein